MSSNPRLFHSICNTICSSHHLQKKIHPRGTPPLSVHTACLHGHSPSLSSQLSPFDIKALCHESAYFASVASLVLMAIHSFGKKSVTLGNICRNTSWIDWAGQICWQIITKTEIECSALWEGRVQPSVAGVLVLISDWSISESNDVMLVTTPYKEISVENQGSETAGNLFMVGLGDYDDELGTKKRGRPFQRYQTWPTFRSTWGRRQGSNNVLFSPK